jgi:hypothetical protein
VINPDLLLQQIRDGFARLMTSLKSDERKTEEFANLIRYDFREDLETLETLPG